MFGPWIEIWTWVKSLAPKRFKIGRPHLNFITIHYLYLVLMSIMGSILLFPAGGMAYIDALFFASGSATQSGLNTIDVNKLDLYQQVVIMLIACVCNPIFIHTFVVFVRLYWFEKRFQHVVREAKKLRTTRSRSRAVGDDDENTIGQADRGVNGREIRVLRSANGNAANGKLKEESGSETGEKSDEITREPTQTERPMSPSSGTFRRDIVFADELPRADREDISNLDRIPERRPTEQHIAFVEKQRNQHKDKGTLYIPGPTEFDRGYKPQELYEDEGLTKLQSNEEDSSRFSRPAPARRMSELNSDDHPVRNMKRHATADDGNDVVSPSRFKDKLAASFRLPNLKGDAGFPVLQGLRQRATTQRTKTIASFRTDRSIDRDPMPYLTWQPTVGRNSLFVDLTEEQREELGGIEYRALKTLSIILVLYFVGFHLIGSICLIPWIIRTRSYHGVLNESGINYPWWGIFTPASMFNDLGFTLTPDSMVSFQSAVFPMLLGSFLIIIGNTGFPCMLRFVIWLASKCVRDDTPLWDELHFLLNHPRRCFTLLFPSDATWWLFWVLVLLNGIDLIFFIILDINDPTVTDLPAGTRVLDGLFQAASTRTAGFACVNVADLHPAVQVSYMIMMYISVFPIAISLRRTNVYEEKSLGVYHDPDDESDGKNHSYIGMHFRRQLSFDLWYVFLGFFFIAIIEGGRLENTNDYAFTLFSVLFEIISAYGTVGLSLGYPGVNTSFSAQFRTLSKLIIIAMQIRGRHRGLPYALDRAILLPSETLNKKETTDPTRLRRQRSNLSEIEAAGDGSADSEAIGRNPTIGKQPTIGKNSTIGKNTTIERGGTSLSKLISGALSVTPTTPRKDKDREKGM